MKARIVERVNPVGKITYVIQQKHFLFRWWWVDAWINSSAGASCCDSFDTAAEAIANLPYFNGKKSIDTVIIS